MTALQLRVWVGTTYLAALNQAAAVARAVIPKDSGLGRALLRVKHRVQPKAVLKQRFLLNSFAQKRADICFVQVGANDGVLEDPLREFVIRYRWRGVLVEPLKHIFERLKQNYANCEGLIFENVAISAREGIQEFYYIAEGGDAANELPEWYTGLGSLSKGVILKHAAEYPAIARRLTVERVRCVTFDSLCAQHAIKIPDVISIDAEGHDFEILNLIDFERYRPAILLYEHHHMDANQKAQCRERLSRYGYDFLEEVLNTICFNVASLRPDEQGLPALWQELKTVGWIPL